MGRTCHIPTGRQPLEGPPCTLPSPLGPHQLDLCDIACVSQRCPKIRIARSCLAKHLQVMHIFAAKLFVGLR